MGESKVDFMQELKDMKIWVLSEITTDKKGQLDKKPFAASGGESGTDEGHRNTWVTYSEAVAAKERFPEKAAAVGFVVPEGYFFLDIDHMELDSPYVQTYLRRYNSHTEKSYSGHGSHIYGKCDCQALPTFIKEEKKRDGTITRRMRLKKEFYTKNPHNGTELYIGGLTNRYAVYTGNVVLDEPLKDCTQAVLTTLDKEMRRKQRKNYSAKRDGNEQAFRIIEALRGQKNGWKFAALFDKGDISAYDNDDSAADCALCAMIAFRTGENPALIEEIFNQSALVRDKWTDREDYRERTIEAGIEACHGVFHQSVMPAPEFIKFRLNGTAFVSAPLLAKYVRENLRYLMVKDSARGGTQALKQKHFGYGRIPRNKKPAENSTD